MGGFVVPLAMLGLAAGVCGAFWAVHRATSIAAETLFVGPYLSGGPAREHAVSRFHARWYAVCLLFLAFDVEMLFMYPWAVVVVQLGTSAIVEMSIFLVLLALGVAYAWREGALEWA